MSRVLVLYSTRHGQAEGIAERIALRLARAGHDVSVVSADVPDAAQAIDRAEAVVIGGSIRYGRFDPKLADLVRSKCAALAGRPNALYSVSLSAAKDAAPAHAIMAEFQAATGWLADDAVAFAGALRYSRYSPVMRWVMKLIARANGERTDTGRDYEYTNWAAVDRFAAAFALRVPAEGLRRAA